MTDDQRPARRDSRPTVTMRLVYLDGAFLPPGQAKVSVFDRGFVFGDGVYEVIPVFGGMTS